MDSSSKCRCAHPIDNRECITMGSGTGMVHTAPGHGQEDYQTGQKYGLPTLSPVDDDGKFTEEAGQFSGLDVLGDGNTAVVNYLNEQSVLVMEEPYKHQYPYDCRTKKPPIFRVTGQWFASVKQAAMEAIGPVKCIPPQVENSISAVIPGRSEWCISWQRTGGVPIPVLDHKDQGTSYE
ncbi:hypothetical protein CRG98_039972 [Punica granatum]|uniref:Aminoacyl-tRNA synthetase class Ia domain-containing protein n=1 Tax=Punica granatum TaxID=22663 RepID=A0A2I0I6M7_PUNGR|nr:hypothetical protein CRG98_039972 [Punica granatum]